MRHGAHVVDPTPGGSQEAFLYPGNSDLGRTAGAVANPNNYLVVPANYDEAKAQQFADGVADMIATSDTDTGGAGLESALAHMTSEFSQGGSQDLQRHPQWGVPTGSFVPAFVGSASNHLGYVTARAGLPVQSAEVGGGVLNGVHALKQLPSQWFTNCHRNGFNGSALAKMKGRSTPAALIGSRNTMRPIFCKAIRVVWQRNDRHRCLKIQQARRRRGGWAMAMVLEIGRRHCPILIRMNQPRPDHLPGSSPCDISQGSPAIEGKDPSLRRRLFRYPRIPTTRCQSTMPILNI
jgi:hypothetical protein